MLEEGFEPSRLPLVLEQAVLTFTMIARLLDAEVFNVKTLTAQYKTFVFNPQNLKNGAAFYVKASLKPEFLTYKIQKTCALHRKAITTSICRLQ